MNATPRYAVAPGRHLALVDDEIAILDLTTDRYSALAPHYTPAVLSVLGAGPLSPAAQTVANNLMDAGILTQTAAPSHAAFVAIPVNGALNAQAKRAPPWRALWALRAIGRAEQRFSGASIAALAASDGAPKPRRWLSADLARAGRLIEAFEAVRPFCFAPRVCLFDAFALRILLTEDGLDPAWVFGVKLAPFAAHCWLQAGDLVLNDDLDHVRLYQPIMIV